MAMIAMTTSNSIRVKPAPRVSGIGTFPRASDFDSLIILKVQRSLRPHRGLRRQYIGPCRNTSLIGIFMHPDLRLATAPSCRSKRSGDGLVPGGQPGTAWYRGRGRPRSVVG